MDSSFDHDSSFEASVTEWIKDLKDGDQTAPDKLWERYFNRLVKVARHKLGSAPRRVSDEEDLAVSVFNVLCQGASDGRFDQLKDRDDLWRLLVAITSKKAVDQVRRQTSQKRGGGAVRGDSIVYRADGDGPGGFEQFMDEEPTPEFLMLVDEEQGRLLALLRDDTQRQIANYRLQGYNNDEIAEKVGISLRSVERKLKLIRETWADQV